jgi:hypothetical protein
MTSLRLTTLVLSVFLAQVALAAKDYYVWVDDNGVTNFSEQKPRDHAAKHVTEGGRYGYKESPEDLRRPGVDRRPPPDETTAAPPPKATSDQQNQVDPDKLIAAQREQLARQAAQAKRKNCEQARKNMAKFQRYARLRTTAADGSQRVMSPEEKQAEVNKAQAAIRENCSG